MTPQVLKYPEDWSGTLPSNRITGEIHTVPRLKNKCFALDGGPFFTESMVITVATTGKVLVRNVDYKPIFLYQDASIYAGQEICAAIAIINDAVSGDLNVEYSILGGVYVSLVDALYQAIEALQLDDRPINWEDIKNKPELYPPEPHIHHVSALYGTEHICMAIYALKQAILQGNSVEMELVWAAIDDANAQRIAGDKTLTDLHYSHANRLDNPHQVTKAQVGLGSVQNFGLATQAPAEAGVVNNLYMTPLSVAWAIKVQAGALVAAHADRTDNPHKVTKAQVNLALVENFGIATDAEAKAASVQNKYMTPYAVGLAIQQLAIIPLNAHIARTDNPHATTKAQVGLGSVENFGIATDAEAKTAGSQNKYMTPYHVGLAIQQLAIVPLTAHINDFDNPHNVTKAQVALGNVSNFGIATDAEAKAASTQSKYMTPYHVGLAITQLALTPLNAHTARTDNPHGVTKAQVGLGSVDNFATATAAQANAGAATNVFMTPGTTRGAVLTFAQPLVDGHANRRDNPHGVNVGQIGAVPTYRAINGRQLTGDVWLSAGDVGTYTAAQIDAKIAASAPTLGVAVSNGPSLSGLVPGARYIVWIDGVVNHGGNKDWVTLGGAYATDSNGAQLDRCPDRRIDNPDGNAPYGAMLLITAPWNGYINCYVDNTNWNITRTIAFRVS